MSWLKKMWKRQPRPPLRQERAQLALERLEDRFVPSLALDFSRVGNGYTIAAEFPGSGVWRWENGSELPFSGWQQLTGTDASIVASGGDGGVAIVVPGAGLWRWEDDPNWPDGLTGWQQLTAATPSAMDMKSYGTVVAEFPGAGVWRFEDGVGWQQLTTANANLVSVDSFGDAAGNFPGSGVWRFRDNPDPGYANGWVQLTAANANSLDMAGPGNVVGNFNGSGVWRYEDGIGWDHLTAAIPTGNVAISPTGGVAANFQGSGVWTWEDTGRWHQITAADASILDISKDLDEGLDTTHADPDDEIVGGVFQGAGIWLWTPNANDSTYATGSWEQITGSTPSLFTLR